MVQWLSSKKMDIAKRVQILDEAVCISHSVNILGKGMNPIFSLKLWINNRTYWAL